MKIMFSEKRAAQMAAYFLKMRGESMSHLKLMKLLYLSDRESFKKHGYSISGDQMASMANGPILSGVLDLMDGDIESDYWVELISSKENNRLSLIRDIDLDELDELSRADIFVLDSVWKEFGHMSRWQIRDYTHENCKEWKNPHRSSYKIHPRELFMEFGWNKNDVDTLVERNEEHRYIDRLFASL